MAKCGTVLNITESNLVSGILIEGIGVRLKLHCELVGRLFGVVRLLFIPGLNNLFTSKPDCTTWLIGGYADGQKKCAKDARYVRAGKRGSSGKGKA